MGSTRREWIAAGLGSIVLRPAVATPDTMQAALREFTGGAAVGEGRVRFDVAPLVENGNTVPIAVEVESPMTPTDHVQAIAVFNEGNPQPDVAVFRFGPRAGRAQVQTRIRLAASQRLIAVARMGDGSHWSRTVDVIVTIAACVES
jgi:sulfur-oxidizing protein SoxY